ncbi:MAG: hypothetical protein JWN04_5299 [Myxococcaceae bacterium]|nr:hypothetical protein [Myxococcaceae bacterium]
MEPARDASMLDAARDAGIKVLHDASLSTPSVDAAATASDRAALVAEGVAARAEARRVLYSWTTAEQASELRSSGLLLTRSERSDGTRTTLSGALATLANANDPLAKLLVGPSFQKGRFGWPSAWATLRGWPGESYGTTLLRIVLKPEAWLARLVNDRLEVVDLQNQPVTTDAASKSPERIAAVYYVSTGDGSTNAQCGSFLGCAPSAYREYFINNESMVEEWSLGTDVILAELERGRKLVAGVRAAAVAARAAYGVPSECDISGAALCTWLDSPLYTWTEPAEPAYLQALALTSAYYVPTIENMDALDQALRDALFVPDPFTHKP